MATTAQILDLADYRRRVAALYVEVRRRGGDAAAWRWWRRERDRLFATHPSSPYPPTRRADARPLPYFPHDPTWRLEVVVGTADPLTIAIGHSADGATPAHRIGRVTVERDGAAADLSLFWLEQYGGGLFLPFRDATCGAETYGGGRYLLDSAKSADLGGAAGRLVLDFNYAYHPSCVHDPRWSCPLAPPENVLPFAVRAGERT